MYQLGQIVNDRYEVSGILEPLAFGQLYRAVQRRGGGDMLLQTMGPSLLPDVHARQSVVQNLSRAYGARHPNVMQLCDLFIYRDDVVLAFQYLEGPTLAVYLEQRRAQGPLSRGEAWTLLEQTGSAVAQYHQLNMIIGALRPEALIVTAHGVMLRDPGVALQIPRGRFLKAARRGRAWSWLAPEWRENRSVDLHGDIYSLAALAHLILYGSPHPFPDGARRGLFATLGRRLRFGARPRPPAQRYALVDQVLKSALAGHPRARPFDVETLLQQLSAALARSPERMAPPAPAPIPKNAGARTVQMPASIDPTASLPAPPEAPAPPQRPRRPSLLEAVPPSVADPAQAQPQPVQAPTVMAPAFTPAPVSPRAPIEAPTMMAPVPSLAPTPSRAPVEAPTMMAPAPSLAPTPAPTPPPTPAPSNPSIFEMDAELPPSSAPNATRQLDSNEINSLLAHDDPASDKNKTRQIDTSEIEALLASTREDPPKKP